MMELALMSIATGIEGPELTLLQRITSLRNCSPKKCFRVQATDTSQHLFRGDCVNQAFMVELLQRN
jgi:hypothetical protein